MSAASAKSKNADRNIDEENPAPAKIVVIQPPSVGPMAGGHDYGNAVNGECHAAFGMREGIDKNGPAKSVASLLRPRPE